MEDSIFTKIIKREIPAEIVYEDNDTLAFLDIQPDTPGHTLVISKTPCRNIFDVGQETFANLMETVRTLAPRIKEAVGADGMRICINNEPAGGQVIFHLHVHVIPFKNDNPARFPQKHKVSDEVLKAVAEKIRNTISAQGL